MRKSVNGKCQQMPVKARKVTINYETQNGRTLILQHIMKSCSWGIDTTPTLKAMRSNRTGRTMKKALQINGLQGLSFFFHTLNF